MKNFKKVILGRVAIFLLISITTGILPFMMSEQRVNAATVEKITKTKLTLYIGETYTLKINGTKKSFKWVSSNKKVAKVSSSGKVTGLTAGSAIITAKSSDAVYKCKVFIKMRISLDEYKINANDYESYAMVSIYNSNDNDEVTYEVYDEKILACEWGEWDGNDIPLSFIPLQDGTTTVSVTLNNNPAERVEIEVTCSAGNIENILTEKDFLAGYARMIVPYTLYVPDSLIINNISYGKDTNSNKEVVIYDITAKNIYGYNKRIYQVYYFDSVPLKDRPYLYDSEYNLYVNYYESNDVFPTGIETIEEMNINFTNMISDYFEVKGFCTVYIPSAM